MRLLLVEGFFFIPIVTLFAHISPNINALLIVSHSCTFTHTHWFTPGMQLKVVAYSVGILLPCWRETLPECCSMCLMVRHHAAP